MAQRTLMLFRKPGITIASVFTGLSVTIFTIVLVITGIFGERYTADSGSSPPKWLSRPADALKRLAGKVIEVLCTIVGNSACLSYFKFSLQNCWFFS